MAMFASVDHAPSALFWDGKPGVSYGKLLAEGGWNIPNRVLEDLAQVRTRFAFLRLLVRLRRDTRVESGQLYARTESGAQVMHFAFFNSRVQVSFGDAGFVPLHRLLAYTQNELMSYVSEPSRIRVMSPLRPTHWANATLH